MFCCFGFFVGGSMFGVFFRVDIGGVGFGGVWCGCVGIFVVIKMVFVCRVDIG